VFLRGDFSEGRDGIYFEYNGESFAPRTSGRKFVLELVARLIADKDKYSQFNLFIESSTVSFAEDASARHTQSMVNQLRLVDLYERLLARGLLVLRGKDSRVLNTENSFRRGVAL
jgi:hypothetical protein